MAIVVLEEMLGGLDEVKEALDRAITVLTDLVEECDPALVPQLPRLGAALSDCLVSLRALL